MILDCWLCLTSESSRVTTQKYQQFIPFCAHFFGCNFLLPTQIVNWEVWHDMTWIMKKWGLLQFVYQEFRFYVEEKLQKNIVYTEE